MTIQRHSRKYLIFRYELKSSILWKNEKMIQIQSIQIKSRKHL